MKKTLLTFFGIIIISLLSLNFLSESKPPIPVVEKETPTLTEPIPTDPINDLLSTLTLDEKIGQMFIISYQTTKMTDKLQTILTNVKPGGFIFFKENFKTYENSLNLIDSIKDSATIPMFLSIDEEGGKVDRLTNIQGYSYELVPPMAEIGKEASETKAYETGEYLAKLLNDFHLNMNFAPVSDVVIENSSIGNRSFGSDPYLVARMSSALAKGMTNNNIIPVYKHFPGHGSTTVDSHKDLPIIEKTKDELLKSDLIPFQNAIDNNAEVIMVGHISLPNITHDNTPASLSKIIITDILRNELGYQNLVITDALNMKALTNNYSEKEIYKMAINAGVNMLLMPNDPENALKLIKELLNENEITEEQINNSVYKILKLKQKYLF